MKGQQLFNHKKISINLARLKTHGQTFEVVIDPDLAIDYKNGKEIDIEEVLKAQEVFFDANKGLHSSENELQKVFDTKNVLEVANRIIKKGEIQLTAEFRDSLREEKKKRIINIIHRNGIDPKTSLPHPVQRIENAFAQAKVHIDEFKKPEEQVSEIIKKLTPILPIRFSKKEIQINVSSEYATKLYGFVQRISQIKKEEWLNDGSWMAVVEIPAGLQNEFFDEINKETHGNVKTKILD
ncbi:ribosome assembly factor SBDS [Candidatus Woesearchaeota archaeon]|jgi:ribosome maturation protein SDO1|nr:ribosome assembly factor SBDS [Candidatus Woesearchaeota archaeon]|tara:strand:+ start:813 stop:1529 length:717 start_codon:yes stop_codon:yes gene_type:complete